MTKKQEQDPKSEKKGKDDEVRRDDSRTGTAAYPQGQDPSQTQSQTQK